MEDFIEGSQEPLEKVLFLNFIDKETGVEELGNLLRVTQLISHGARVFSPRPGDSRPCTINHDTTWLNIQRHVGVSSLGFGYGWDVTSMKYHYHDSLLPLIILLFSSLIPRNYEIGFCSFFSKHLITLLEFVFPNGIIYQPLCWFDPNLLFPVSISQSHS